MKIALLRTRSKLTDELSAAPEEQSKVLPTTAPKRQAKAMHFLHQVKLQKGAMLS